MHFKQPAHSYFSKIFNKGEKNKKKREVVSYNQIISNNRSDQWDIQLNQQIPEICFRKLKTELGPNKKLCQLKGLLVNYTKYLFE